MKLSTSPEGRRLFVVGVGVPVFKVGDNQRLDSLLFLLSLIHNFTLTIESGGMHSTHPIKDHTSLNEKVPYPLLVNKNKVTLDAQVKRALLWHLLQHDVYPETAAALAQLGTSKELLLFLRKLKLDLAVDDFFEVYNSSLSLSPSPSLFPPIFYRLM